MTIICILLVIVVFGLVVAYAVLWEKYEKAQEREAEEHEAYLSALRIGNLNAEYAQRIEEDLEHEKGWSAHLSSELDDAYRLWEEADEQRDSLQDFKSSTLCPRNDHIWQDGVCKRCKRRKDDGR